MNEKTTTKVLIPSMYSANYCKSKNMSVGTVCIKRFKFVCMTILSPETVSLVLCQWSIADMQVPPVPNQHKNAEILAQNALKMQIEATIYQKFSREKSPVSSYYQSGDTPSRALPSTGTLNVTAISCVSITCSHHRRLRSYPLQSNRQGLIHFVLFFFFSRPRSLMHVTIIIHSAEILAQYESKMH